MNILIVSLSIDPHGIAVATVLEDLGHRVVLWSEPLVAGTYRGSIYAGESDYRYVLGGINYGPSDFDIVWMRRHSRIEIPHWIHEDDRIYVQQENNAFFRWFWSGLSKKTIWVHSLCGYLSAETKIIQLQMARDAGFSIPETLLSNDADEIRRFIAAGSSTCTVYKTFYPMGWNEGDVVRPMYTTDIGISDVEDSDLVAATPGIFQRRAEKAYEVRATFFGQRELSIKIDSQHAADGKDDWRQVLEIGRYIAPMQLPDEIRERCLRYMHMMDMDVGCFDFIVDKDDRYTFLEVNQQGQFLWIEVAHPSLPFLREFCEFILARCGETVHPQERLSSISFRTVYDSFGYRKIESKMKQNGFYDSGVSG